MVMLKVCNLSKKYDKKCILDNLNFEIEEGSIVGVIGVNGAGKTTLLKLLAGIYEPDQGEILYDGIDINKDVSPKKDIYYLSDDPYYSKKETPYKYIQGTPVWFEYMKKRKEAFEMLKEYGIPTYEPIGKFSKGMKRLFFLAYAIASFPKWLYLDEAFDGVDPIAKKDLKRRLLSSQEINNMTVLISSHSLRELEDICDSFLFVSDNKAEYIKDLSDLNYHKYVMAYNSKMDDNSFKVDFVSFERNNRVITCVTKLDYEAMKEKMDRYNPLLLEEQKIGFEEIFLLKAKEDGVRR